MVERLLVKVSIQESGCWIWKGLLDRCGYGMAHVGGRNRGAHRIIYELLIGPIPVGLQLDHLCRVRNCVNPDHLEPVTPGENYRRSPRAMATSCIHGHPFDEANTYVDPKGRRNCRTCNRGHASRLKARKRAEQS